VLDTIGKTGNVSVICLDALSESCYCSQLRNQLQQWPFLWTVLEGEHSAGTPIRLTALKCLAAIVEPTAEQLKRLLQIVPLVDTVSCTLC
jgi:hypothetical protein